MTLFAGGTLLVLAGLGWYVTRSLYFPPAVFAAVWGMALALLGLSGDAFYSITDATRLFYVLSVLAFGAGGVAAIAVLARVPRPRPSVLDERRIGLALDLVIVVMLLTIPAYWAEIQETVRMTAIQNIFVAARIRTLQAGEGFAPQLPFLLRNLIQLSIVFTFVAFAVARSTWRWRLRCGVLLALALGYQLMTGARGGAVLLVIGVVGVAGIRRGRIPWRLVVPALGAFLVVFAVIGIQLEKDQLRRDAGLAQNIPALWESFQGYALGGIVAFDRVLEEPDRVPSTGGLGRTAKELANRFGANYEIPSLHAQYTPIADFRETNVYTTYFSYVPDFGAAGTLAILASVGLVTTAIYWAAAAGSFPAVVLYGVVLAAVCQSIFNEPFFGALNLLIKTVLLLGLFTLLARARWRVAVREVLR